MDIVLEKIVNFGNNEAKIRAIMMNGSRVNSNAPKDCFQDYDVILFTTNSKYYSENQIWMDQFGEMVMFQHNYFDNGSHIYLMLFKDMTRIDMTFYPIDAIRYLKEDSLSVMVLDKDGLFTNISSPSEKSYFVKKPTKNEFMETVNDFFWCMNNVAKGIYRDEIVYVKMIYENIIRTNLINVLEWYIGLEYDFQVNPGKYGKWFKRFLSSDIYNLLLKTYFGNNYDEIWESLFVSCELMHIIGVKITNRLNLIYPYQDEKNMIEYLKKVRNMTKEKVHN